LETDRILAFNVGVRPLWMHSLEGLLTRGSPKLVR